MERLTDGSLKSPVHPPVRRGSNSEVPPHPLKKKRNLQNVLNLRSTCSIFRKTKVEKKRNREINLKHIPRTKAPRRRRVPRERVNKYL